MTVVDRAVQFIELTKANPLWALATSAFLPVLWFVVSFAQDMPARSGEFDRSAIRFELYKSEQDKVGGVYEALLGALGAFLEAAKIYREKFAGRSEEPERAIIVEGARLATDARDKIARATGTIEGTSFEDKRLQEYKVGLLKDVGQLRDLASLWQRFYFSSALGQKEDALRIAKSMNEPEITQAATAMKTRVEQFNELSRRIQQEYQQDIVEQQNKARVYTMQEWVALAGFAYVIGFSAVAAAAIYRRRAINSRARASRRR
jgi:hypothetical protein